jgi:hypothetical protein
MDNSKVKDLFDDLLKPMIVEGGLASAFKTLCGLITYMVEQFRETAASTIGNKELEITDIGLKTLGTTGNEDPKTLSYVAQYTNLVTLCMAKGALDFYKYSPNTQENPGVHVADNGFSVILIDGFQLALCLQDNAGGDLPAPDGGDELFKPGNPADVGKLV